MSALAPVLDAPDERHLADRSRTEDIVAVMILDQEVSTELIRDRREKGIDAHDEVWDGVYMIMPIANREHQRLIGSLTIVLTNVVEASGPAEVYPGLNVSDRGEDWESNFRCPDVAVYLKGNPARPFPAHYQGGPDFAVEIVSPKDQSHQKLDFYAKVGTRELLVIDRDPWRLELYRLSEGALGLVGVADVTNAETLTSEVVPLRFRLVEASERPRIEITHGENQQRWLV